MSKLEALWWMSRLYVQTPPLVFVTAGWLCARESLDPVRYPALLVFVALISASAMWLNDLMDHEEDRVTAPYLPLPAGLLERRDAWAAMVLSLVVAVAALAVATVSPTAFLGCASFTGIAALTSGIYSKMKSRGVLACLVISVPLVAPVGIGWLAAGGGSGPVLIVALHSLMFGFSNNILAALRDIDGDPLVGNETIAVRLGGPQAFRLGAAVASANMGVAAALALSPWGDARALVVIAAAAALLASSIRPTLATLQEEGRGRGQRIADLERCRHGEFLRNVGVLCALDLTTGIVLGAALELAFLGGSRLYRQRIIRGGILAGARPS